jgi:hypothetical protein
VKVFRRADDGTFPRVAELTRDNGDTLASPVMPGWSIELAALFADV